MDLATELPTDVSIALRRFAHERGVTPEAAAIAILRDWLVGHGLVEIEDESEETGHHP